MRQVLLDMSVTLDAIVHTRPGGYTIQKPTGILSEWVEGQAVYAGDDKVPRDISCNRQR